LRASGTIRAELWHSNGIRTAENPRVGTFLCKCNLWDILPFHCYWSTTRLCSTRFRHAISTTASARQPPADSPPPRAEMRPSAAETARGPTIGTFLCKCQLWDFPPFLTVTGLQLASASRFRHDLFTTASDRHPLQTRCVPEPRCGHLQLNGKRSHN